MFVNDHFFSKDFLENGSDVEATLGTPFRIARDAFFKTSSLRRSAKTNRSYGSRHISDVLGIFVGVVVHCRTSLSSSSKRLPETAWVADSPVKRCHRRMIVSM